MTREGATLRAPIDTTTLTFIAGSDPRPVLDMEGRPRADKVVHHVPFRERLERPLIPVPEGDANEEQAGDLGV